MDHIQHGTRNTLYNAGLGFLGSMPYTSGSPRPAGTKNVINGQRNSEMFRSRSHSYVALLPLCLRVNSGYISQNGRFHRLPRRTATWRSTTGFILRTLSARPRRTSQASGRKIGKRARKSRVGKTGQELRQLLRSVDDCVGFFGLGMRPHKMQLF